MASIRKYWLEAVVWVIMIVYMSYILMYYSWQAFIINAATGILGYMATFYFGDIMPIIGSLMRRKKNGDSGR